MDFRLKNPRNNGEDNKTNLKKKNIFLTERKSNFNCFIFFLFKIITIAKNVFLALNNNNENYFQKYLC